MKKRRKNSKRKILLNNCWREMSLWTRCKNADSHGFVVCVSCGAKQHYKDMQAGHFWHGVLDYDPININPQCVRCNKWLSGNLAEYAMYLIKTYGLKVMEELWNRKNQTKKGEKYSLEDLEKLYVELHYKNESKNT